jgi:predicted DNA-binding ribbon-helix-helix protein
MGNAEHTVTANRDVGLFPVLLETIMRSVTLKRSVIIGGHKTSVSLEDAFWTALKDIGRHYNRTLSDLVRAIADRRQEGNLSSAIRLFVLEEFRAQAPAAVAPGAAPGASLGNGYDRAPAPALEQIQP